MLCFFIIHIIKLSNFQCKSKISNIIYIYIRNNNCSLYKNFITINNLISINCKISCFNKNKLSNSKIIIFIVYILEETNSINKLSSNHNIIHIHFYITNYLIVNNFSIIILIKIEYLRRKKYKN